MKINGLDISHCAITTRATNPVRTDNGMDIAPVHTNKYTTGSRATRAQINTGDCGFARLGGAAPRGAVPYYADALDNVGVGTRIDQLQGWLDIQPVVKNVEITLPLTEIDVTTLDSDFMQRITGMGDCNVSMTLVYDPEVHFMVFNNYNVLSEVGASDPNGRPQRAKGYSRRGFDFQFGPDLTGQPEHRLRLFGLFIMNSYNLGRGETGEITSQTELMLAKGEPMWLTTYFAN